jgi:hypothetical protein
MINHAILGPAGVPGLLGLVQGLARVRQRPLARAEIDAALVPPVRGRAVYGNRDLPAGAVDRDAYVLCVLEQLRAALRRRDVFAAPSLRRAGPRAMLLDGPAWEAVRPEITARPGAGRARGSTCGTWPARWMPRGGAWAPGGA